MKNDVGRGDLNPLTCADQSRQLHRFPGPASAGL